MAIYTQYGRYLKAKAFKDQMESSYGIYMLLGLGNPRWRDAPPSGTKMDIPIAPYNTSVIRSGDSETNQFYDNQVFQYLDTASTATINAGVVDNVNPSFIMKVEDILPPFPCIWKNRTGVETDEDTVFDNDAVSLESYQNYYITPTEPPSPTTYRLHEINGGTDTPSDIQFPTNDIEKQYFAELYLRGLDTSIKNPVGLLGAIKCDISFVRDIGNNYSGSINQFYYGDRYWEIVNPDDNLVDGNTYAVDNDTSVIEYPHHLLITAIINPRQLCGNLDVDQCIVPTQIALYTKTASVVNPEYDEANPSPSVPHFLDQGTYKVGDFIFNFGQYTNSELNNPSKPVLNFTRACASSTDNNDYPNGQFRFILTDYIRGNTRDQHSADRIGYIIGF